MELTRHTENILPAVATGIQLDVGLIFIGMVLPFWAVIGGLIGLVITVVANPILFHHGILKRWHQGMATVDTVFANNFDFYMSFGIGLGLAGAYCPGGALRQYGGALLWRDGQLACDWRVPIPDLAANIALDAADEPHAKMPLGDFA